LSNVLVPPGVFVRSLRKMMSLVSGFILALMAGGCATKLPASHEIENPGHLLVSLQTSRQPSLRALELDVELQRSGLVGVFRRLRAGVRLCRSQSMLRCDSPDYREPGHVRLIVARRLPAGEYVIRAVRVVASETPGGFGFYNVGPARPLNIPFTITPGVTSYLGRYRLLDITGKETDSSGKGRIAAVSVADRVGSDVEDAKLKIMW